MQSFSRRFTPTAIRRRVHRRVQIISGSFLTVMTISTPRSLASSNLLLRSLILDHTVRLETAAAAASWCCWIPKLVHAPEFPSSCTLLESRRSDPLDNATSAYMCFSKCLLRLTDTSVVLFPPSRSLAQSEPACACNDTFHGSGFPVFISAPRFPIVFLSCLLPVHGRFFRDPNKLLPESGSLCGDLLYELLHASLPVACGSLFCCTMFLHSWLDTLYICCGFFCVLSFSQPMTPLTPRMKENYLENVRTVHKSALPRGKMAETAESWRC